MTTTVRKKWLVSEKIPEAVDTALGEYPPVLRQLLWNRGIDEYHQAEVYLNREGSMYDPFLMTGMHDAVMLISRSIKNREPIAVYGDYDVDGVTATAIMVQVLRSLGGFAWGYIPNRFDEGYGLNCDAINSLNNNGVNLILTVDCGIRSPMEVRHAHKLGMNVVITDHHEPLSEIPLNCPVICPKQVGDRYPEKNLAGVGLAYKLTEALIAENGNKGIIAEDWLDLVAIGTVADVVPLTGENRSLVKAGLQRLRQCRRQGLISLAAVAGINLSDLTAQNIGYVIGPRLNAAGRMESALDAYSLIMSDDLEIAGSLAQKLEDQNRARQELTRAIQEQVEQIANDEDQLLFAADPAFNMGIVGLVASRLTDQFYRPAVVCKIDENYSRGSCRSIPEFHITKALDSCSDLLVRHGGHSMAAGFTVANDNLMELGTRLKEAARSCLTGQNLSPTLYADMEVSLRDLHPVLLNDIHMVEPTGLGNHPVNFVTRGVNVSRSRTVGHDHQHLKLTLFQDGLSFDAIAFQQGYWSQQLPSKIDILYAFEKNSYHGNVSLQLNIRDLKPANRQGWV